MYKEVSKSNLNKLASLIVCVFAIFAVMIFTNNIIYPINKLFADIINILFFGFCVYFYMRYIMTSFEYKVENNSLVITKLLNKNNPQIVLMIGLKDIENVVKYETGIEKNTEILNLCATYDKSKRYAFFTTVDSKKYMVLFEPTNTLLEIINEVKS